jgi:hypothetical protein
MKKFLYAAQVIFLGLFVLTLLVLLLQLTGRYNPLAKFDYPKPEYNQSEEYDSSLSRLNSVKKLIIYCDSLFGTAPDEINKDLYNENYINLVSSVVRNRFYHGYSWYGFGDNYVATVFARMTNPDYSAIVIPDDILKFPFAACSQQSILMMEVLKTKGFKTRKIGFQGKKGGHFCFEVFYNGGWHFYDTNMEPDETVLRTYNHPGIAFLASNPEILAKAYQHIPKDQALDLFTHYSYGRVNQFPAPRAIVFHKATKILSYTCWIFFLAAFLLVRRRYRRLTGKLYVRNSRVHLPQSQPRPSSSYYRDLTAPGT